MTRKQASALRAQARALLRREVDEDRALAVKLRAHHRACLEVAR